MEYFIFYVKCYHFFFIYYIIFIYSNYVYIIFLYTNLPCFVKRPRAIVIDWALYKYFYYYYYYYNIISTVTSKIVIIFKRVHRLCWGEGVNGCCTLLKKCWLWRIAYAYMVVKIQNFQSTLLGGRGHKKKSTLCTLLIMLTIMDDPLGNVHSWETCCPSLPSRSAWPPPLPRWPRSTRSQNPLGMYIGHSRKTTHRTVPVAKMGNSERHRMIID